jgi:hypothetical protein
VRSREPRADTLGWEPSARDSRHFNAETCKTDGGDALNNPARILWNLKTTPGQTQTLTASGNSGLITLMEVTDVWLGVYVTGTATGTSPTLDVQLDLGDPDGNWFPQAAKITQLTSSPNYTSVSAGLHVAGGLVLPRYGRITWTVGGTGSPTWPGVSISLIGR